MKRLFSLSAAFVVNFGLFALIQGLVQDEPIARAASHESLSLSVVRAELQPTPPDEPQPEAQPQPAATEALPAAPAPPLVLAALAPPATLSSPAAPALGMPFEMKGKFTLGKLSVGTGLGGGVGATGTASVVPTLRVQPIYPARAEREGIEGFVVVEFEIQKDGSVDDVSIVQAEPPRVFDRAVSRAVRSWKFPLAASSHRHQERIDFELQETL